MRTVDLPLERIREMRFALEGILSESATVINAIAFVPLPGSIAHAELQSFSHPLSIKTAQDQSYLLLESAADYLSCLIKAITEPVESIAPWSLTRSVLESAATSIWVGSPIISASERVNRSLAFRLKGLQEQVRLAKAEPSIEGPSSVYFNRLIEVAADVGAEVKIGSGGIPTKVGTHFPTSTDLCDSQLGEATTYRILSALAHSQPFAIQQLGFKVRGPSADDAERVDAEKHLSNLSVAFLCTQSGRAFMRALCARLKLYGYLTGEVVEMLRKRADELQLTDEQFRYCIWSS